MNNINVNFERITERKFNFFKNIFTKKDKELSFIQERVDTILENKQIGALYYLLKDGYNLTKKQEDNIVDFICYTFLHYSDRSDEKEIHMYLGQTDFKLSPRALVLIYLNSHMSYDLKNYFNIEDEEQFISELNEQRYPLNGYPKALIKNMYSNIKNKDFLIQTWAENIYEIIKSDSYYSRSDSKIINGFNQFKNYFLTNANLSQLKFVYQLLLNEKFSLSPSIDKINRELFSLIKMKEAKQNQNENNEEFNALVDMNKKIHHKDDEKDTKEVAPIIIKEELPIDTKEILSEINSKYIFILNEKDNVPLDIKLDIDVLIKNRIPEFINVYHSIYNKNSIDPKTNKSPAELLNHSLNNILNTINNNLIELDQNKINTLKANITYTESYKAKM